MVGMGRGSVSMRNMTWSEEQATAKDLTYQSERRRLVDIRWATKER
jgi:hypothetical protein